MCTDELVAGESISAAADQAAELMERAKRFRDEAVNDLRFAGTYDKIAAEFREKARSKGEVAEFLIEKAQSLATVPCGAAKPAKPKPAASAARSVANGKTKTKTPASNPTVARGSRRGN
jgi:hypothetical protein